MQPVKIVYFPKPTPEQREAMRVKRMGDIAMVKIQEKIDFLNLLCARR